MGSHIWAFDWHICIWPWPILKVMVMHILTVNVPETDMGQTLLSSNRKSYVGFWLFTYDLRQFKMSRSRSCIFLLQISRKLEHISFCGFSAYMLPFVLLMLISAFVYDESNRLLYQILRNWPVYLNSIMIGRYKIMFRDQHQSLWMPFS